MHELWHVLLAHTRLYARPTPAHNVAFDAIINAGLARQHPAPEYLEFFERLNPPDVFPGAAPAACRSDGPTSRSTRRSAPAGRRDILQALYPPPGGPAFEPTYEEILQLLDRRRTRRRRAAGARRQRQAAARRRCSATTRNAPVSSATRPRPTTTCSATWSAASSRRGRRRRSRWAVETQGATSPTTWGAVARSRRSHDVRQAFAAVLRRSLGTSSRRPSGGGPASRCRPWPARACCRTRATGSHPHGACSGPRPRSGRSPARRERTCRRRPPPRTSTSTSQVR